MYIIKEKDIYRLTYVNKDLELVEIAAFPSMEAVGEFMAESFNNGFTDIKDAKKVIAIKKKNVDKLQQKPSRQRTMRGASGLSPYMVYEEMSQMRQDDPGRITPIERDRSRGNRVALVNPWQRQWGSLNGHRPFSDIVSELISINNMNGYTTTTSSTVI